MRRTGLTLLLVGSIVALALAPSAAQTPPGGTPPFRPVAGRFEPGPLLQPDVLLCVLDTWTGRVHIAPLTTEPADGVKAWVVDLPEAQLWERPLARDVSAGHVLQHGLPLSGIGAGAPVFAWASVPNTSGNGQTPGILDTRTGAHYYLVDGKVGAGAKVLRTDLRMLSRSVREVKTAAGD